MFMESKASILECKRRVQIPLIWSSWDLGCASTYAQGSLHHHGFYITTYCCGLLWRLTSCGRQLLQTVNVPKNKGACWPPALPCPAADRSSFSSFPIPPSPSLPRKWNREEILGSVSSQVHLKPGYSMPSSLYYPIPYLADCPTAATLHSRKSSGLLLQIQHKMAPSAQVSIVNTNARSQLIDGWWAPCPGRPSSPHSNTKPPELQQPQMQARSASCSHSSTFLCNWGKIMVIFLSHSNVWWFSSWVGPPDEI